jgi:hypothetical protein
MASPHNWSVSDVAKTIEHHVYDTENPHGLAGLRAGHIP